MRKYLIVCFVLTLVSNSFSQSLKGYLGKNYVLGAKLNFSPEIYGYRHESSLINKRYSLTFGKILSRNVSAFVFAGGYKSKFIPTRDIETEGGYDYGNGFQYEYSITRDFDISSKFLGLAFEFKLSDELLAPLGAYYRLGCFVNRTKITDSNNDFYGETGYLFEKFGDVFKDPNYIFVDPYITTGFGARTMLYKDILMLDYGINFSFGPGMFKTHKVFLESKSYSSKYAYIENKESLYEYLDRYLIAEARKRNDFIFLTDIHIGLNLMF